MRLCGLVCFSFPAVKIEMLLHVLIGAGTDWLYINVWYTYYECGYLVCRLCIFCGCFYGLNCQKYELYCDMILT
jgi:hypothetical protein